ncbi:PH domain-containing protein [Maribacter polysaccharolyticus]|uniref:PH domain-containing protein n=1 Tax=Maribacter polysaccharolyticus TaxID=3020831 RepID=UPI00237FA7D7|nr:PH domain-containing protein [Maribacter polysaccharolyticus]MDE3744028.1 hypothetical protein [Maribacter polysaccharolyticus]
MRQKTITLSPVKFYAILKPIMPLMFTWCILIILFIGADHLQKTDLLWSTYDLTELYPYALGIGVLAFVYYIYKVLYILSHRFNITHEQIEYVRGVFSVNSDFVELYRVKDLMIKRPFLIRLLIAQNLSLITSDKSHPVLLMFAIPYSNIHEVLRELVEKNRQRKGVYEID